MSVTQLMFLKSSCFQWLAASKHRYKTCNLTI